MTTDDAMEVLFGLILLDRIADQASVTITTLPKASHTCTA